MMFPIYLHAFMILFALNLPYSDGKLDLWSQQELQDRIEALEKQDLTKSPIINLLTEELQDQKWKLTAQKTTINNLSRLLDVQASNLLQKDKIIASLQENIDNLKGALGRTDAHAAELNIAVKQQKPQFRTEDRKVKVLSARDVKLKTDIKETLPEPENEGEMNGSEKFDVAKESVSLENNGDERETDNEIFQAYSKKFFSKDQHDLKPFSSIIHKNDIKQYAGSSTDNDKNNSINKTSKSQNMHQLQQRTVYDGQVAFHARVNQDSISSLGLDQTIKFEDELLDLGHGYHSPTGVFTAPKAGLYLFSASVCSWYDDKSDFNALIVKNGVWIAAIAGHGGNDYELNQGSATVAMQLDIGDDVWVENAHNTDVKIAGWGYTTFTGVLISEM